MGKEIRSGRQNTVRILLTGYVGNNNLGDDLMMMETVRFLQEEYPEAQVSILIRYQGCKTKMRQNYGENLRIINLHPFRIGKIKEWIYGNFIVTHYDLVLWVGGTCFADIGGNGLYSYFKHNIKRRIPYGYLGVGIDYFEDREKRKQAAELFAGSLLTVFRDETSLRQAERLTETGAARGNAKLKLSEDIVYRVLRRVKSGSSLNCPKEKRLLISWRYQSQYMEWEEEEKRMSILEDAIAEIAENYEEIVFLPIDEHMDSSVNGRLADRIKARVRVKVAYIGHMEAMDKLAFIASSESYICGRLHGVMIAELSGCNVAALSYSLKTQIFMESIGRQCDTVWVKDMTKEKLLAALSCGSMKNCDKRREEGAAKADKNYEYLAEGIDSIYEK
ncbi:MAG: polysaccharide pyruvyl transferase family protein [Lachnospiraceae bacterium]|nr:polysaccharide pyruvyl transferase family protein [Lachnospiraceae bacterium]